MKKAFSKVLVMILTVCMLLSVLSVGISAAYIPYPYPVYLTLSQQYQYYYYSNVVTGTLTENNSSLYKNGTWHWQVSGSSSVSIVGSGSYATLTTTSTDPVAVTVTATVIPVSGYSCPSISESITITVYPNSYLNQYPDIPYWWYGYDWSDVPYWWMYDWYGTYPYASNVLYVNGTAYPWCGSISSSDCSSSWCIHTLVQYPSTYITYDTTYCSVASCGNCGNPFRHHTISWFVNGISIPESSSTPKTVESTKSSKTISAVDRLTDFRKNQGKTEETEVVETKKTTSKWVNLYKDVNSKSWFYNYVKFVSENDYIQGKDTYEFGINTTISRAEFAEALGKFAGVKKDKAADYVNWAVEKGFLTESSDKTITKEEAVNAVYKYVVSLNKKVENGSSKTNYSDADKVSEEYKDAVEWAISNGLIGVSANKISPADPLVKTRLAQFLYNLNTYLGK